VVVTVAVDVAVPVKTGVLVHVTVDDGVIAGGRVAVDDGLTAGVSVACGV
jgi:hypothetical protein